jgi:sucrose-6-phosphate hydrolase SacC (GH32 family)
MQTGYLSLSASSHSESSMWSMFTDLCFVLLKSSHPFTCFPMVSHTFSYAYFFNVLASTNVQASDVLQHPHKQLYRTAFHYQPAKNWMNDPNAPMYYKEYYHLFYQYNPHGPVWGNLTWAHAVSKDLVHWLYLEDVLKPDQWYDVMGVWSGSATIDPDGIPFILYTGQLKPNFR